MVTVLSATTFDAEGSSAIDDPDQISDLLGNGSLVWVDLLDPTDDELARMGEEFSLHELAIEDAQHRGQRPKLELYPDHAFIVVYVAERTVSELQEVHLFIGPDWLISVRTSNSLHDAFDPSLVRSTYERTRGKDTSVGFLLYRMLDEIVDGYFEVLDWSDEVLDQIETDLFDEEHPCRPVEIQRRLLDLRKELMLFRRRVMPTREVLLAILRKELPWVDGPAMPYFQDVLDHVLRVTDQVDIQRELLSNVVDAEMGLEANRMNGVMKKMTSWGAILIAATLIAGVYGMNFENMPELRWQFGYPVALLSMLFVTSSLYLYFKRKDWL